MKRVIVWCAVFAACVASGCTKKYAGGVSVTMCEVWIYSMPQGALLYFGGQYVGRTPYRYVAFNKGDSSAHFIARPLSEIVVRKRGCDDEMEAITVANCYKKLNIENQGVTDQVKHYKGNITLYLDTKEGDVEKEHGNVVISAVPEEPDAEIYLNDSLIGNGKTALLKLPSGSYILKVHKPGYKPYSRVISVLADNDVTVSAILEKAESEDGGVSEVEGKIELSPAGRESELEEDYVPGTVGGKE